MRWAHGENEPASYPAGPAEPLALIEMPVDRPPRREPRLLATRRDGTTVSILATIGADSHDDDDGDGSGWEPVT